MYCRAPRAYPVTILPRAHVKACELTFHPKGLLIVYCVRFVVIHFRDRIYICDNVKTQKLYRSLLVKFTIEQLASLAIN
jgi:hypothetical protein